MSEKNFQQNNNIAKPPSPLSKLPRWVWWFLLGLAFIAVFAASTREMVRQWRVNIKTDFPVHQDPLASWQTYRNEKYGYEFRYPADWKEFGKTPQRASFVPVKDSTNLNSQLDIWSGENIAHGIEGVGKKCEESKISVAGMEAEKLVYCGVSPEVFTGVEYIKNENAKFIFVIFEKDDISYSIEFSMLNINSYKYEYEVLESVLSTFKFIE